MKNSIGTLFYHVVHFLPLNLVDYKRLTVHILASVMLSLALFLTTHIPFKEVANAWAGASLIYVAGYLQRGIKEEDTIPVKIYDENGKHLLNEEAQP
jgi:hypothetical protein